MSRVFSVQAVLRQTSLTLIRDLLARLNLTHLPIDWDSKGDNTDTVYDALLTLPATQYDAVEGLFRTLFDLACSTGIAAVREAAICLDQAVVLSHMPMTDGLYDSVAWMWLQNEDVVEFAGLIHQVEQLHWWRRRNDLPRREPDSSPDTLRRLGQALSALLQAEQGRGRNCTVEALIRTRTRYYFAYPDDYVQNVTAHNDQGELRPRTFRRTFSLVFAFDPTEGALELYAGRLAPRLKQQIESVFASVVLGFTLPPWAKPTFQLDRLKLRGTSLPTDPTDRVSVSVTEIRLELRATKEQITLKINPDREKSNIYDMIDNYLNQEQLPLSAVEVDMVAFCFEYLDAPRGRGRTMSFHVAKPNSCSLRNQRQSRIDLAMKYLEQWGVYVRGADPGLAEAG
jgi:hypothetical protein